MVSIVKTISKHVGLDEVGTRYIGYCPFHKQHTPSFTVHPDEGFFHCFECKNHGNEDDFIQLITAYNED
jgi:DNA primase